MSPNAGVFIWSEHLVSSTLSSYSSFNSLEGTRESPQGPPIPSSRDLQWAERPQELQPLGTNWQRSSPWVWPLKWEIFLE